MKIVCASSLTSGREAFATAGEIDCRSERSIDADAVRGADALATRSKVRVNAALLAGSRVRFVGTATAGTDHFDTAWLDASGVRWCAAPGCNANSVAEYIAAALLTLAVRHGWTLAGRTIAVIGVGHVGKLVARKCGALGMRVLLNDPPLAERTGDPAFRPLAEILAAADFVTLHVPLHDDAPHATRGLAGPSFFRQLKPGAVFLNASRGEVVQEDALRAAHDGGAVSRLVLDVFDREPAVAPDLLQRADIVSPHIAGYSHQGKLNGTAMVYREMCRFFGIPERWTPPRAAGLPLLRAAAAGRRPEDVLAEIVRQAYDIEADDRALRAGIGADLGAQFEKLRRDYPERHEFDQYAVQLDGASAELRACVAALGFQLA